MHILLLILKIHIVISYHQSLLPTYLTPEEKSLLKCIKTVLQSYDTRHSLVAFDYDLEIENEIIKIANNDTGIIIDITRDIPIIEQEISTFIVIAVSKFEYLEAYLNASYDTLTYNTDAKYLVIYRGHLYVSRIFEIFWKSYITRILVIDERNDVYKSKKLLRTCVQPPKFLFNCNMLDLKLIDQVYNRKIRNMHGCIIKVGALIVPPYVINVSSAVNPGLEIMVLNAARDKHNFTLQYVKHNESIVGASLSNGTFTDLLQLLRHKEVDIIFGKIRTNRSILYNFSGSMPYLFNTLSFHVPRAKKLPNWINITKAYNAHMWLYILCMSIIFNLIIYAYAATHNISDYNCLIYCALRLHAILLNQMVNKPQGISFRLLLISWILFTFVISSIYQGTFISFLVRPAYEKQIASWADMLESGLTITGDNYAHEIFTISESWENKGIFERIQTTTVEEGLNRTAFKGDAATLASSLVAKYYTKEYYLDYKGRSKIYALPSSLSFHVWFVMNKGLPLKNHLSDMIWWLYSSGILYKWTEDVGHYPESELGNNGYFAISLDYLLLIIYLYVMGMLMAMVVFIIELIVCKCVAWHRLRQIRYLE